MKPSLYELNIGKIRELLPRCHWAGESFLNECQRLGIRLIITSAYRPQSEQDALYAKGRSRPGLVVTWTRKSRHTERLAIDLYPVVKLSGEKLNDFYATVEEIAARFGIFRDPALIKLGDFGHFDFGKAAFKPIPDIPKSAAAAIRRLDREIKGAMGNKKKRLEARKALLASVNWK